MGSARLLAVIGVVAACGGTDRYGTYVEVSGPAFDQLEFFFGGMFPNRRCQNDLSNGPPPAVNSTATWSRVDGQDPRLDTVWRRQVSPGDVQMFPSTQTAFDYYVPSDVNDPAAGFTDTLGKVLVIVAKQQGTIVGVARIDNFVVKPGEISKYPIKLDPGPFDIELWGAPGPTEKASCLRWTIGGKSTFIVREWDHDCDGLETRICDYDGMGTSLDDCDPLTFCHADTNVGCDLMHEGCFGGAAAGASETTCRLVGCSNTNGAPQTCVLSRTDFCLGESACGVKPHCDRDLLDCVLIDSEPDLVCKVPVADGSNGTMKGTLCPAVVNAPTAVMLPWASTDQLGCGTVVKADPRNWLEPVGIKAIVPVNAVPGPCALDILEANQTLPALLPTTRVMITVPNALGTTVSPSSFLVELAPDYQDCTDPTPQCQLAGMPLGTLHVCP